MIDAENRENRRARRAPQLDARLRAALDMAAPCEWAADIGADHGRLSASLLSEGRAQRMLVADISPKALAKAQALLLSLSLGERAVFAVADGLEAVRTLPEGTRLENVFLLGMGGDTIAGVLRRGRERLGDAAVVLGAQTQLEQVRAAVQEIGCHIDAERVVRDGFRWYTLMRAKCGACAPYSEKELWLGPCLLQDDVPDTLAFWQRRVRLLTEETAAMRKAGNAKDETRFAQAERELKYLKEALACTSNK